MSILAQTKEELINVTYSFIASSHPWLSEAGASVAARSEELEFDKTMNGSRCRSNYISLSPLTLTSPRNDQGYMVITFITL